MNTIVVVKALLVYTLNNVPYFLELTRSHTQKVAPGGGDLPGGKVEAGESLEAALIREIKEETSIDAVTLHMVADHQWTHGDRLYHEHIYYVVTSTQNVTLCPEEHVHYRWIPLSQLRESSLHERVVHIINQEKESIIKGLKI